MDTTFYTISLLNKGKPILYRTVEGFSRAYTIASAISKKGVATAIRPLNRASGQHRVSELRD